VLRCVGYVGTGHMAACLPYIFLVDWWDVDDSVMQFE
jgi:hypothetical protein